MKQTRLLPFRRLAWAAVAVMVLAPVSAEASLLLRLRQKLRGLLGNPDGPAETSPVPVADPAPAAPAPLPVPPPPPPPPPLPPPEIYPDPLLSWISREAAEQSITLEGRYLAEAVGVGVQNPAASTGTITDADASGARLRPEKAADWNSLLTAGRHYFLEISGPPEHAWAGHRLELDEVSTRATGSLEVRWEVSSPLHTRTPDAALAGATYQIRPHVALPDLFAASWEHRWRHRPAASPIRVTLGRPGQAPLSLEVRPNAQGASLLWLAGGQMAGPEDLILTPGSGLVIQFADHAGLGSGLAGETRTFPCRVPLVKGWNLLAYPYPKDMRIGVDWPHADAKATAKDEPSQSDRLVTFFSGIQKEFGLWSSPQGPRWRAVEPATGQWREPAQFLETIPSGYAFYLFRQKPNPHHAFLPPAP